MIEQKDAEFLLFVFYFDFISLWGFFQPKVRKRLVRLYSAIPTVNTSEKEQLQKLSCCDRFL
ncbi:hypothetical protein [[Phormidium ambiguum] IAM M-71]|uniref:hypothetical protein n=1 Tax=[Phormidium ambiguum] IAM M-71 TaxID=454136 RepID=UPI0011612E98|nr:hypothetical protein [Phormidium ambiguum]